MKLSTNFLLLRRQLPWMFTLSSLHVLLQFQNPEVYDWTHQPIWHLLLPPSCPSSHCLWLHHQSILVLSESSQPNTLPTQGCGRIWSVHAIKSRGARRTHGRDAHRRMLHCDTGVVHGWYQSTIEVRMKRRPTIPFIWGWFCTLNLSLNPTLSFGLEPPLRTPLCSTRCHENFIHDLRVCLRIAGV